jgi:uridine kinase
VIRPLLIGIAGASGSGKTELARNLATAHPGEALHFELDHYYRDLSHLTLAERAVFNFDHPDALDADLLVQDLAALQAGRAIAQPRYSFVTHTRLAETQRLEPMPLILVEGLFSLYWPELRALLDLKIYVETPDEECFRRRMERDVVERGRTPQCITDQYEQTVRPMALAYVRPTEAFADLVVSGVRPLEESTAMALEAVRKKQNAQA